MAGWNTTSSWNNAGGNSWGTTQQEQEAQPMEYDGSALDWGDAISFSGATYIVLKPGEYDFTVKSFERGYYNGSQDGKSGPCPTAKVAFEVEAPEGRTTVTNTFYLRKWESAIDFIYNFFVSVGMITPEQREAKRPFVPDWQGAVGRSGRFEIKNTTQKKEEKTVTYNNIKKFIDPPKR